MNGQGDRFQNRWRLHMGFVLAIDLYWALDPNAVMQKDI